MCSCGLIHAQHFVERDKIVASDRRALSHFGFSVSMSDKYAIVGTFSSAYVFEQNVYRKWIEVKKVVNPERMLTNFGRKVLISGNFAFVSATTKDEVSADGKIIEDAGAVYIYERHPSRGWEFKQKITAIDKASFSYFGDAMSTSSDYLAVGAYAEKNDSNGNALMEGAGAVYIFNRDPGGQWVQSQKIVASDRSVTDHFGFSLSISGNNLIVGAPADKNETPEYDGSIYFFERDITGLWTETQKLIAPDPTLFKGFGLSTNLSDNIALVGNDGADAVHIFERDNTGLWKFTEAISPSFKSPENLFGGSLSFSEGHIVVGASWQEEDKEGAAYVYRRGESGKWEGVQKVIASQRSPGNEFGYTISMSGENLLVGSFLDEKDKLGENLLERAGSAYFFILTPDNVIKPEPEVLVEPKKCPPFVIDFIIPNVITPNGDSYNDQFVIQNLFDQTALQVFDRYGKQVFQNANYNNEWSGAELSSGIYYWTATQSRNNCLNKLKGWISIIR